MKKRLLSVLFAVCMVLAILPAAYAAGEVKSINSYNDLVAFAESVNNGTDYSGETVTLNANINMSGKEWTPIGVGTRSGNSYEGMAFKGTFNGNGKTITGLSIKSGTVAGLFGVVDGGTVKDLTLASVQIDVSANADTESKDNVGAAIGLMVNGGTVENVTVSGSLSGYYNVGGVVGTMTIDGTVTGCTNRAAISGQCAGGIVGKAYYSAIDKAMTISNCVNSGTVTSDYDAGGIVGFSAANVSNCSNSGTIKGVVSTGGIVGEQTMYGTISGNTNSGAVTYNETAGTAYGGIVGWVRYNNSTTDYPLHATITVSGNTNSGKISASGASLGSGGIVGSAYNQATVTGNTNTAASITGGVFAAGIVGGPQIESEKNIQISGETITVTNNISTTSLSAISANCKDLYAYNNDPDTFKVENNSNAWVAKIGNDKYTTLQAAVDAAEKDDTVTLLSNVTLSEALQIAADKKITLDLNGKTISQTKEQTKQTKAYSMITNMGDLTIKDSKSTGKISYTDSGSGGEYVSNTILNSDSGTLTVLSGTIENLSSEAVAKAGYPHAIDNSGALTVKGGAVYSAYYSAIRIWCDTDETSVVIEGGTITGAVDLHNVDNKANKGTLTITGGTFKKGLSKTLNGSIKSLRLVNFGSDIDELSINVSGGSFAGEIALSGGTVDADLSEVVTISGGTFSSDVTEYCADGYKATKSGSTYKVVKMSAATIRDLSGGPYSTLAEALEVAYDGATITLLDNIVLKDTLAIDKNITLNLNGKTITSKVVGARVFQVNEGCDSFVLNGNGGKIVSADAQAYGIIETYSAGTLTINGGTYDFDTDWGALIRTRAEGTVLNLNNLTVETNWKVANSKDGSYESVTVTGGTYTSENAMFILVTTGEKGSQFTNVKAKAANGPVIEVASNTAVFENCTFTVTGEDYDPAPPAAISVSNNAVVTVKSGTYTGSDNADDQKNIAIGIYTSGGTVNVEGGKLDGDVKAFVESGEYGINISGGTVNGGIKITKYSDIDVAVSVTGGSFKADVNEYCPKGYSAKETNGTWTVLEDKVAKIGTKTYPTLQKAFDAAASGNTIVLMENIVLDETLLVDTGKWVTLNLNGFTISQTKEQTEAYSMIENKGDLTIMDGSSKKTGKISYTDSGSGSEYVSNTIHSSGTLTVESGTIENLSSYTVADNGYPHAIDTSGALLVKGGTVYSENYSAIRIWCTTDDDTTVTIKGGTITGAVDMHNVNGNANKGTLTITGGTFKKGLGTLNGSIKSLRLVNYGSDIDELSMTVSGGTFEGGMWLSGDVNVDLAEVLTITGGTYSTDVSAYVAEGFAAVKAEGKDVWTIKDLRVIKLNGQLYASLQAAIADAKEGDTITLTGDVYLTKSVFIGQSVILEGGKHTITYVKDETDPDGVAKFPAFTVNTKVNFQVRNLTMMWQGDYAIMVMAGGAESQIRLQNSTITADAVVYNEGSKVAVNTVGCNLTGSDKGILVFAGGSNNDYYVDAKTSVYLATDGNLVLFDANAEAGESNTATVDTKKVEMQFENTSIAANAVALIGNTYYDTLADALAVAKSNSTITLLADGALGEDVYIKDGTKLTIDLNEKTLSLGENGIYVNKGRLNVTGTGTINADGDAFIVKGSVTNLRGFSVLTIGKDVTVNTTGSAICVSAPNQGDTASYGVEVTIDGKIVAAQKGVLVSNAIVASTGYVPAITINGTIEATETALDGAGYAKYVANGNLKGASAVVFGDGQLTINKNAVLTSTSAEGNALYVNDKEDSNIKITITGGTFEGIVKSNVKTGFITGGTFTNRLVNEDAVLSALLASTVNAEVENKAEDGTTTTSYSYFTSYSAAVKVAAAENINDFTQRSVEVWSDGKRISALQLGLGEVDENRQPLDRIYAAIEGKVWGSAANKEAYGATVNYVSSDDEVASVCVIDGKLAIEAHKVGRATITATTNKNKVVRITVTVTQLPTEIGLSDNMSAIQGGSATFTADVRALTWSISKIVDGNNTYTADETDDFATIANGYATLSTSGRVVVGRETKAGTLITVRATSKENKYLYEESTLTVVPAAKSITITEVPTGNKWVISGDKTLELSAELVDLTNKKIDAPIVSWTSSNKLVADVTVENGVATVTALKAGSVTITVSGHGKSVRVPLNITVAPKEIEIEGVADDKVNQAQGYNLKANVTGIDGLAVSNKTVTWAISKIEVGNTTYNAGDANFAVTARKYAAISSAGRLTIARTATAGAKITVTATSRALDTVDAEYTVTVQPVANRPAIIVDGTSYTRYSWAVAKVDGSETKTLTVSMTDLAGDPMEATLENVVWTPGRSTAISFEDGTITALNRGSGSVSVRCTMNGKTYTASCSFIVSLQSNQVTTIPALSGKQTLTLGRTLTLRATASRTDNLVVGNRAVDWSVVEGENVTVTVTPSGLVKTIAAGNAKIRATAKDGGAYLDFEITVVPRMTKIAFVENNTEITIKDLKPGSSFEAKDLLKITAGEDPVAVDNENVTVTYTVSGRCISVETDGTVKADNDYTGNARIIVKVTYGSVSLSKALVVRVVNPTTN